MSWWSLTQALRSPGVHFVIVGALLYSVLGSQPPEPPERATLEISPAKVDQLKADLHFELGRSPSSEELRSAVDSWIDEEVLIRHALELGLDREPAVERRLAQIAAFVDGDDLDRQGSDAALADRARELGLHLRDRVVRNILIDRASRLIRAAVLVREPTDAALQSYLEEHAEIFQSPSRLALAHVELRGASSDEAEQMLDRITRSLPHSNLNTDDLTGWGDPPSVPSVLPGLTERELNRRFGPAFVNALAEMPDDQWSGPVRSPHGLHLVKILERRPGALPSLSTVRDQVRGRLRHELAERWLHERLNGLRAEFDVRLGPEAVAWGTSSSSEVPS